MTEPDVTIDEERPRCLSLHVICQSDVGCTRESNEDAAFATLSLDGSTALLAVADGMGGQVDGELASNFVTDLLRIRFLGDELDSTSDLRSVAIEADGSVAREFPGAGTTLVAALVTTSRFELVNIGDSRAYLFRDGGLKRLTTDHSWVQAQIEAGRLNEETAWGHPRRNVLLMAIGTGRGESPDTRAGRLLPEDVLLLCSDGLHGVLRDEQIAALLSGNEPDVIASSLVEAAKQAGGPDNISVALATVLACPTV